jgi:hypothetical protein
MTHANHPSRSESLTHAADGGLRLSGASTKPMLRLDPPAPR